MRRLQVFCALALAALASLVAALPASAAPDDPFQYKFSIDGAALPSGLSFAGQLAVNEASGNLLVLDRGQGQIHQMDANGNPVQFSATGSPSLSGGGVSLFVDNSGGASQGNIYLFAGMNQTGGERFSAWRPNGEVLVNEKGLFYEPIEGTTVAGAVDFDGKVWVLYGSFNDGLPHLAQLDQTGNGAGVDIPIPGIDLSAVQTTFGPAAFDRLGNFYFSGFGGGIHKFDGANNFADLGPTGLLRIQPLFDEETLLVDPSNNDLYSRIGAYPPGRSTIRGVEYSDPLVKSEPYYLLDPAAGGVSEFGGMAFDPTGQTLYVAAESRIHVFHREPARAPFGFTQLAADGIRSTRVALHGGLSQGGAATSFFFEYGTDTSYGASTTSVATPFKYLPVALDGEIEGLQPNTTYHARMVAVNAAGTSYGPDRTFTTYPSPAGGPDPCPNALARKETAARALPDCRAFELVSASDTGGYDVESQLAPGQTPFSGYPWAQDRVLYATHSGAVPGPWQATNRGPDPYLASRGADGWHTDYLGLPADLNPFTKSFSSTLGEADPALNTLAFAGSDLCAPCFPGASPATGVPVRLANGQLVQGMTGSVTPDPSARPEGKVAKSFSADGRTLVFASQHAFESGANSNGDLTVYARNIEAGRTEIVSTNAAGAALTGTVSELDISADGSRVVTGVETSTDAAGNEYVHPYMHFAGSPNSVDLAPGSGSGVLFAGMTADGSKVFFTSDDQLIPADLDGDADLYEAAVGAARNLTLTLVTPGDSTSCNPVANGTRPHWNSVAPGASCDAVAIAGGGGVASASGAVYFLSPEQLDGGNGTQDQPNLYRFGAGSGPIFVATFEPDNPLVLNSVGAAGTRRTGDFQITAAGDFAVFRSALELTGVHTFDLLNVFRFGAAARQLTCVSCDFTGTADASLVAEAELAPAGLSLINDGRVFFTTRSSLVLNDANDRKDVYASGGVPQLISAGTGPFDSSLLTVSADGKDAFFFTRDALAPVEDHNGSLARIYDAREGGGFFHLPPDVPCAASDECHGPGTVAPGPPDIKSSGKTSQGNAVHCKKNQVKRSGKCVKKKKKRKKSLKKHGKGKNGHGKGSRGKQHA